MGMRRDNDIATKSCSVGDTVKIWNYKYLVVDGNNCSKCAFKKYQCPSLGLNCSSDWRDDKDNVHFERVKNN